MSAKKRNDRASRAKKDRSKNRVVTQRKKSVVRAEVLGRVKAKKAFEKRDWPTALKLLSPAWEQDPSDPDIVTVMGYILGKMGHRSRAIEVIERAISSDGLTPDLVGVISYLALDMELFEIGEKVCRIGMELAPDALENYVNYAHCLSAQDKLDEAVDFLQGAIPLFADNASIWNVLGTVVMLRDGPDVAEVFYQEALRLNPRDVKVLNNLALSRGRQCRGEESLEISKRIVEIDSKAPEPRVGLATSYFGAGNMKEGWANYRYRLDASRSSDQVARYLIDCPQWDGEPIKGKTVLMAAEQGLGDEMFFSRVYPHILGLGANLIISCQVRLVSIYKRCFPQCFVTSYKDVLREGFRYRVFPELHAAMKAGEIQVDYYAPTAGAGEFIWQTKEDLKRPKDPVISADPELAASFKDRLDAISRKPRIGLAWTSGNRASSRIIHYLTLDDFGPLWGIKDQVEFINLQYTDVASELSQLKANKGVEIHRFDDVDLKQDIEANLAIMENCDVVISVGSAPLMFAAMSGRPTIACTWGVPWYAFSYTGKLPVAKDLIIMGANPDRSWSQNMELIVDEVVERLSLEQPS